MQPPTPPRASSALGLMISRRESGMKPPRPTEICEPHGDLHFSSSRILKRKRKQMKFIVITFYLAQQIQNTVSTGHPCKNSWDILYCFLLSFLESWCVLHTHRTPPLGLAVFQVPGNNLWLELLWWTRAARKRGPVHGKGCSGEGRKVSVRGAAISSFSFFSCC